MTTEVAMEHFKQKDALFLDIRTPAEWLDTGVIPMSVLGDGNLLPLYANTDKGGRMLHPELEDKDRLIIVYCKAFHRGFIYAKLLREMGYKNAIHLEKGISDWIKSDGPIVQPNSYNKVIRNIPLGKAKDVTSLPAFGRSIERSYHMK